MAEILFVNACVREEQSRTLKLARHFLARYGELHPEDAITERNLMRDRLQPLYRENLEEEEALVLVLARIILVDLVVEYMVGTENPLIIKQD